MNQTQNYIQIPDIKMHYRNLRLLSMPNLKRNGGTNIGKMQTLQIIKMKY